MPTQEKKIILAQRDSSKSGGGKSCLPSIKLPDLGIFSIYAPKSQFPSLGELSSCGAILPPLPFAKHEFDFILFRLHFCHHVKMIPPTCVFSKLGVDNASFKVKLSRVTRFFFLGLLFYNISFYDVTH